MTQAKKNEVIKQVSFVGLLESSLTNDIWCRDYATVITTELTTGVIASKPAAISSPVFSFDDATQMLSVDASLLITTSDYSTTYDHVIRLYTYIKE